MSEMDNLMDTIVAGAMLDHGASPNKLVAQGGFVRGKNKRQAVNMRILWKKSEDQYLREHLGKVPLEEISRALGRSENALKIRFGRKGYIAPSKISGWVSMSRAGSLLGLDSHKAKN